MKKHYFYTIEWSIHISSKIGIHRNQYDIPAIIIIVRGGGGGGLYKDAMYIFGHDMGCLCSWKGINGAINIIQATLCQDNILRMIGCIKWHSLRTQDLKYEPWRSEAEHATSVMEAYHNTDFLRVAGEETCRFFETWIPDRGRTQKLRCDRHSA